MSIFRGVQQGDVYSATENLPAMQQNINNMMMRAAEVQANAYESIGKSIGGGIEKALDEYNKNKQESEYLSQSLEEKSTQFSQWSQILSSDPKYAKLASSLAEYRDKAIKGPTLSHSQKKALDVSLGTVLQNLPSQVQMINVMGERQEKFDAANGDRQSMIGTLSSLRKSLEGDPRMRTVVGEIDTNIGRLTSATDLNGVASAVTGAKNFLTLMPRMEEAANRQAVTNATADVAGLAANTPAFRRSGNALVQLPQSPLTLTQNNKTLDMTPSEFISSRTQQLRDAGVPEEQIEGQLAKDLADAQTAIRNAKGLEPLVQQQWLEDFYEAEVERDPNMQVSTADKLLSSSNIDRASAVVGKEIATKAAGLQETPVIKSQRIISEKFTSNDQFVSGERTANVQRQKDGKPVRAEVRLPDGRVGFEVSTIGPDGKAVNLGGVGSYKEELEVLQRHRLANLPKYLDALHKEAVARGYRPNGEQYNNFVKSAREDIRVALLEGLYPQTIKDANGNDVENPEYTQAAQVYEKVFGGQSIDLTETDLETAANLMAVAAYTTGGVAATDIAVQQLIKRNPWGFIDTLSGGKIKGPEQFKKWVEAEKAKGVAAFNQKVQGILDGRIKSLVDDTERTVLGGKQLLWTWKDGGKYVDPTNSVKPEVLEAATEYRRARDSKYTELYQLWKQNNPNKTPSKLDHASFTIGAEKAAREAVDRRAKAGGLGLNQAGVEKELIRAQEEDLLKKEHPAIAAEVTDGNGNIDIDAAKKKLGAEAAQFERKAVEAVQEALSPEAKAARLALENREKIVRKIGGGGWKGLTKRVGAAALVTFGTGAYLQHGSARTPEYKALSHAFGEDGVVDKRIRTLSIGQSESKTAATNVETMRRTAALQAARPANAGQSGTTPVVPSTPVLPARKTEVPNYAAVSRQERINSIAGQLQTRHGITFGEASALASTFVPETSGPQMKDINGVLFYSGDGKDWKPVPAENAKMAGGMGGANFNETFFGSRVINPETREIEIKPQAFSGFAVLGRQPTDAVDRRKLRSELIGASAAKRAIAGIRKEIADNPVRGGPLNFGGSNTAIRQKYVLGLFKSALDQSGQDSRPSDLDVKNIMDSLARASDMFTTDKTALRALDDFEAELDARLTDIATQNGLQISIDRKGSGLEQLEQDARTEQFTSPR